MRDDISRGRRGRPPKFGRRGQLVAVTLPEEVVAGLRKLHPDLAWAIVALFENTAKLRRPSGHQTDDPELVSVGGRRSLIVVSRDLFNDLPGVNIIPLHDDRAFLALQPGCGMSDLELAVIDRLAAPMLDERKRKALAGLRELLRKSRADRSLRCEMRAVIVIERARRPPRKRVRPSRR